MAPDDKIIGNPTAIQENILTTFGFLTPPSQKTCSITTTLLPRLISLCWMLTTFSIIIFEVGKIFYGNNADAFDLHQDLLIVELVKYFVYVFYPARGFIVLLLFILQHRWSSWCQVSGKIQRLLSDVFPDEASRARPVRKLKICSLMLTALTVSLHVTWVSVEWTKYEGLLLPAQVLNNYSASVPSNCSYKNYDICFTTGQMVLLWVPAVDGLFIVSQQVLALVVTSAVTLLFISEHLHLSINREIVRFHRQKLPLKCDRWELNRDRLNFITTTLERKLTASSSSPRQWTELSRQVKRWTWMYTETFLVLEHLKDSFGWILLVSVSLDVMTALGVGTTLITSNKASPYFVLYHVCSAGLFLSYATLLFLPLVFLHEKCQRIERALTQLHWKIKGYSSPELDQMEEECSFRHDSRSKAADSIEELTEIVKGSILVVKAGGLCSFTRSFPVTIVTTVFTILLLARELLEHAKGA
ncbi:hypothetical protein BV898_02120 [Hypsibius exemplaris]|uniref:Gustatory receptor n=1 Tax=Hypsibius exemplaris TaxID=2072580 RepID=A0A1W0X9T8_HYPEX|nr:hypothetical protein BV898_02120 [Hypsibius exemplaris]